MKIIISSFIILLLASANTFAQKYIFRMYRFECSELYDISLVRPKNFKVIDGITMFKVNEKNNIGWGYRMALESEAKDCLILFPFFNSDRDHNLIAKRTFYGEVEAALGLHHDDDIRIKMANGKFMNQGIPGSNFDNKTIESDSTKHIKIITQDNMVNYSNADSVFIWKIPLPEWHCSNLAKCYKEIYNECIGISMIKKGHPSATMKILLTEEGKKKEEEYMQILFKSIHYSNIAPECNQEKIEKTHKKLKYRFFFHRKTFLAVGDVVFRGHPK